MFARRLFTVLLSDPCNSLLITFYHNFQVMTALLGQRHLILLYVPFGALICAGSWEVTKQKHFWRRFRMLLESEPTVYSLMVKSILPWTLETAPSTAKKFVHPCDASSYFYLNAIPKLNVCLGCWRCDLCQDKKSCAHCSLQRQNTAWWRYVIYSLLDSHQKMTGQPQRSLKR